MGRSSLWLPSICRSMHPASRAAQSALAAGATYPTDGASLVSADFMDFATAPTSFWLGGEATQATDTEVAGNDLTDVGTVDHEQVEATLAVVNGGLSTDLTDNASEAMQAGAAGTFDWSGPFAALWLGNMHTQPSTRGLFGCRQASGTFPGWEVRGAGTGQIQLSLDDGASETTRVASSDHRAQAMGILVWRDVTAGEVGLATFLQTVKTGAHAATGTLANTQAFQACGYARSGLKAAGQRWVLGAVWDTSGCEGIGEEHLANLKAALSL